MLRFDGSYVDEVTLEFIRRAELVLLPYHSREQSGPGCWSMRSRPKPVVATAFPHAVELLGGGAGLVVEQQDSAAIGEALHRVLTEPGGLTETPVG